MQQDSQGSRRQTYSVEILGPILPHAVAGLARLFATTQHDGFMATNSVHEPTIPFNCVRIDDADSPLPQPLSTAGNLSISSPGNFHQSVLLPDLVPSSYCDIVHTASLGKEAVRELVCANERFTWTKY